MKNPINLFYQLLCMLMERAIPSQFLFKLSLYLERNSKFVEGEIWNRIAIYKIQFASQDYSFYTRRSPNEKQITHQETNEQIEMAFIHT